MKRAALALGCLTLGGGAAAQPRAQPVATVVRALGSEIREARSALTPHLAPISRCLADARAADPVSLSRLRFIDAVIRLARDGTASAVELTPPLTTRGLSACMADTLLDWSQRGRVGQGGAVTLRIQVTPR